MDKLVLKASGNCNFLENGDMSLGLRANVELKLSSKTVTTSNDDCKFVHVKKLLAVRNDELAKILNSKTYQPLFIDFADSRPVGTTSSNICDENMQPQSNQKGTPIRFANGNVIENMTSTPIDTHPQNRHLIARLQRDLDSPSAAARVRAIRALNSPTNGPYNQFDVPHDEQDIITEEERQDLVPKTIQDVMKNVIVYVEARYGNEDRTSSVKSVLSDLGATVNNHLNKNTTHVIFKDGLQSTYNKAKTWNIPIVSILWIEACKRQLRLVDPSKYTIQNSERYENPELYKKVKIRKFYQTENELKIKKPKKTTPTAEKFHSIKFPKKTKDNSTGNPNDFRDEMMNNQNSVVYFSENSKLAGLVSDGTPITPIANSSSNPRQLFFSPMELSGTPSCSRVSYGTVAASGNKASDANSGLHQTLLQNNANTPCTTLAKRKTMLTKVLEFENSAKDPVRVTRRSSLLMLPSPSIVSTPIQKSQQIMEETSTDVDNQTKNNPEGMDITLDVAILSNIDSTASRLKRKTLCVTSSMEMTNPQPVVISTQKRRSVMPSKYKDYELNEYSKFETEDPKKTDNLKQSHKTNGQVSTLHNGTVASKTASNHREMLSTSSKTSSDATIFNTNNAVQNSASSRRRTLFTPNQTVSRDLDVMPFKANGKIQKTPSNRRRTLFAPSTASSIYNKVDEQQGTTPTEAPSTKDFQSEISNVQTPNGSEASASKQLLPYENLTPQNHRTLFEEYSQRLTFSSTNKRRSVFDVSMHIIEQRLKNINEIARSNRSVSESDVNFEDIEKGVSEKLAKSSPQLGFLENREIKQKRVADDDNVPSIPKRRKLFDPTTYEEQIAEPSSIGNNNNKSTNPLLLKNGSSGTDRSKEMKKTAPRINKLKYQRKSIMDFQIKPTKPVQVYASAMKTGTKMNYLAYTNMNQDQIKFINQTIATLGNCTIEPDVTGKTTHLVTIDSKRTQKLLRAIIRGLWIIDFDWVTASLSAGVWLYEEPFENRSFSKAISMCRAEAQAFGSKYKINIFTHLDPIYISSHCKCKSIRELYLMCGGRVTHKRAAAKYVVTDKLKREVNQICLHSNWILDSISIAECKNPMKYVLKFMEPSLPTQL